MRTSRFDSSAQRERTAGAQADAGPAGARAAGPSRPAVNIEHTLVSMMSGNTNRFPYHESELTMKGLPATDTDQRMMVFTGNANRKLSQDIVNQLRLNLGNAVVERFSDGEVHVEVMENVRGRDVFIVQSTCAPTNDNLMELLVMIDALRRASAWRITAVIPYFGYARQDRRPRSARVPITAKVVAQMISTVKADRVLTVDLHSEQLQGFFDMPVDNVYASPILLGDIWRQKYPHLVVVSPDVGGVVRARALAKRLDDAELAIIDKRRSRPNVSKVMNIIGEVEGRSCVMIDDLVDTAGTLCRAAEALKREGAKQVVAYCTHPVLSGKAVQNIEASYLDELVVTDTIPLSEGAQACGRIRQLSIAAMLAETMRRVSMEESVSSMYMD
jgi:ribose-phosphate pyrophosphokinase